MASAHYRKSKSSVRLCEEKYSCLKEGAFAEFHCTECKSDQCPSCETEIHKSKPQLEFHNRIVIELPPYEDLCQIASLLTNLECEKRNFADLHCDICERNFCVQCFDSYHKDSSRRTHKKVSIKEYKTRQQLSTVTSPIKPLSPLGVDDDSLTFISCPQDSKSFESMMSHNSFHSDHSLSSIPDVVGEPKLDIISLTKELEESQIDERYKDCDSFPLVNEQENLQVSDLNEFVHKLKCDKDCHLKVLSIFGNTGDGKSHTLNHTFFGGKEVFKTSAMQVSCTIGAWASFDPDNSTIIIDTEGLLGVTTNQNQRTRLLLKLLAVSDVVIYRTRAERLHNDMFYFLGDASKAYTRHFTDELRAFSKKNKVALDITNFSPSVVVFHETQNTSPLDIPGAEVVLRDRFKELDCTMGFSDLKYVGTRTARDQFTDFTKLRRVVQEQLNNNTIRAPRKPGIVFKTFEALNEKFSGEIENHLHETFPDQYFTCNVRCKSCNGRCVRSMNHNCAEEDHMADKSSKCKYQHQYENKIYFCKKCYRDGKSVRVVPKTSSSKDSAWVGLAKYVWSGDILECSNCGIIYKSHQYWYNNPGVENVVHEEVAHVWPEGDTFHIGTHNAARRLIDGISYVAESIGSVSNKPKLVMADWMADQIAPAYWVPNAKIKKCKQCERPLSEEQKHHCRACGQGFCDDCSSQRRPVPDKGWSSPVRVCDGCLHNTAGMTDSASSNGSDSQVTARKVGESVTTALDVVASAFTYPIGMLKDSARPAYWVPDDQISACCVCEQAFSLKLPIHHCRGCGQGVCDECSPARRPVPLRGWDYPVRVCRKCEKKKDKL